MTTVVVAKLIAEAAGDQCEINEDGLVWNAGVAFAVSHAPPL